MKKILSIVLICSLLLAFLSSCSYFDRITGNGSDDEIDNIETGNSGNETGDIDSDNNTDNPNNEENKSPRGEGKPVDMESDVIASIFDFLDNYYADHDMPSSTLDRKIRLIDQGYLQPFEITFEKSDYYFICGYDNYTRDPISYQVSRAKNCNWYRFDSAEDIPEYYNNEKCAYVFQFNKASSVVDMLEMGNIPMLEHFLWFLPEFEEGYNVKAPEIFDETIIYLCRTDYLSVWDEGTVYYSTSSYDYRWVTIPFVEIEGVKYTTILTKYVRHNETNPFIQDLSPEYALGEYYDVFKDVIEENIYVVDRGSGTDYYSCIKIWN